MTRTKTSPLGAIAGVIAFVVTSYFTRQAFQSCASTPYTAPTTWQYVDLGDIEVELPGTATPVTTTDKLPSAVATSRTFDVSRGSNATFEARRVDVPLGPDQTWNPQGSVDGAIEGGLSKLRTSEGVKEVKVLSDTRITLGDMPGRVIEATVTTGGPVLTARFEVVSAVSSHFFFVMTVTTAPSDGDAKRVFASIRPKTPR